MKNIISNSISAILGALIGFAITYKINSSILIINNQPITIKLVDLLLSEPCKSEGLIEIMGNQVYIEPQEILTIDSIIGTNASLLMDNISLSWNLNHSVISKSEKVTFKLHFNTAVFINNKFNLPDEYVIYYSVRYTDIVTFFKIKNQSKGQIKLNLTKWEKPHNQNNLMF